MTALLEVTDLKKSYGSIWVLRGVDFTLAAGEVLALIGPNGAGKTTLFKCVSGEVRINNGTIRYMGDDVAPETAHQRVRRGMGRTFQVARIFPELTALENLIVAVERSLANAGKPVAPWFAFRPAGEVVVTAQRWLDDFGLHHVSRSEAKSLSHGDKKRLELAAVLALKPRLLLLDEPTAGMSRSDRQEMLRLLSRVRSELGLTIMMTEHDMDVVFGLADRLIVMNYGELIAQGSPAEVRNNQLVRQIYLGKEAENA